MVIKLCIFIRNVFVQVDGNLDTHKFFFFLFLQSFSVKVTVLLCIYILLSKYFISSCVVTFNKRGYFSVLQFLLYKSLFCPTSFYVCWLFKVNILGLYICMYDIHIVINVNTIFYFIFFLYKSYCKSNDQQDPQISIGHPTS